MLISAFFWNQKKTKTKTKEEEEERIFLHRFPENLP